MSHKASYWAISRAGLTPTQKLALMALADCHNGQTGQCFPSIETLAKVVNVSRSTIKRALSDLERAGLIEAERRFTDRGQTSNAYRLHMKRGDMIPDMIGAETPVQNDPPPGSPATRPPVHQRPPNLEMNREKPPFPFGEDPPKGVTAGGRLDADRRPDRICPTERNDK